MFGKQKSTNPMFRSKAFQTASYTTSKDVMTVTGTANKTALLTAVLVVFAAISWTKAPMWADNLFGISIGVMIGGIALIFATYAKPEIAQFTAPLYCVIEGIFLGLISFLFESKFPGIVVNAVVLTLGILVFMAMAYRSGWIRATPMLKKILMAGLFAYLFLTLAHLIMGFFGSGIPSLFASGPIGIGFSVVIVGLASFFLILDFDQIETGAKNGAPKHMEWVGALGLMVTLIWLYLEVLSLLSKLQSRD